MLGPDAVFREGQLEAIQELVEARARVLLVQKTGWGKSLVYFIATKLLREQGLGPALLVSPLLALMRNQIQMADRIGVRALSINSANSDLWADVEESLREDACDILLVSPERLANERFQQTTLPSIGRGIGFLVVDEAHCISDWGHDFRPDYRRIVRIVRNLPGSVPVLATTATANDRVVADVAEQLGPGLRLFRGELARPSLRLQTVSLPDQAERLAWLSTYIPDLPGSGIIYCLTVADVERVSAWLAQHGIDAPAYHGRMDAERIGLEERLLRNDVKALVATVALGMGFDKPDLGFVVHFQRPGSVVAYYQQIGRAGRAVDDAYAILLHGREDDEIQNYFIRTAFPDASLITRVLEAIEDAESLTASEVLRVVNAPLRRVEQCLKFLEVDGAVVKAGSRYARTVRPWTPDIERSGAVTRLRGAELERMRDFVSTTGCLMEFVANELDDPAAKPCGRCANCAGEFVSSAVRPELVRQAVTFLRRSYLVIEPRRQWPPGVLAGRSGRIAEQLLNAEGRALCIYGDAGWGKTVQAGKYGDGNFGEELVGASAELIRTRWKPGPPISWVTCVPSIRHPELLPAFARRLARAIGLPYRAAIEKVRETRPQKAMENSALQLGNIASAFQVDPSSVLTGPVLLVDDMVDSRWTLTLCGVLLREAGSGVVYPFALASTAGASDS